METFAVYADCAAGVLPSVDEQCRLIEHLLDPDACVWTTGLGPGLIKTSFDVTAVGFEDALHAGKRRVTDALANAGLVGEVVSVVALTEHGQARWTPDDAANE